MNSILAIVSDMKYALFHTRHDGFFANSHWSFRCKTARLFESKIAAADFANDVLWPELENLEVWEFNPEANTVQRVAAFRVTYE